MLSFIVDFQARAIALKCLLISFLSVTLVSIDAYEILVTLMWLRCGVISYCYLSWVACYPSSIFVSSLQL
jgi:hypothetical protein